MVESVQAAEREFQAFRDFLPGRYSLSATLKKFGSRRGCAPGAGRDCGAIKAAQGPVSLYRAHSYGNGLPLQGHTTAW